MNFQKTAIYIKLTSFDAENDAERKNRIIWSIRRKTSTSEAKYLFSPDATTTKSGVLKHGNGIAVGFWSGENKWAVLKMGLSIFRRKRKEILKLLMR